MSHIYSHDWNNDPFTKGAYSYCAPGEIESDWVLAEPVEDTLFFAGEATDMDGFTGTVPAVSYPIRIARSTGNISEPDLKPIPPMRVRFILYKRKCTAAIARWGISRLSPRDKI